jgi:hypothetical protein
MNIFDMRTMILCHRNEKKINQVCFVESSFGQKVRATFPIAQYRIASPYQNGAIVVCLRKTNTNSFILSQAYINNKQNL